ncbi:MAG TPA: sugar ABC transporter permease [Ardenticatenaceae bacterium]|nr:sugar ABC transporter permease [Ardenticatenaceae bacterium]
MQQTSTSGRAAPRRSSAFPKRFTASRRAREARVAYLFMLPALLFFLTFQIYPLFKAFQISLHDWAIMPGARSEFLGFANYTRALADPIFWTALRNTVLYTVVTVPAQMALAMLLALVLHHITWGRVFFRTLYYLPVITSWVVVSLLFKFLFHSQGGLVNYVLKDGLHLVADYIPWLQNAGTALLVVMLLGIWKGIGWSMVIFLAALQGIPHDLHEVAAIDGANRRQRFWNVTLPLMRPTLVFVLVMLVIGGFNVFLSVFLITGGGPMHRTESILTYMYGQAFDFLELGYGSALSFLLAGIIFTLSFLQIRFFRRPVDA